MPGFYPAGDYDLAGFCIGVVEKDEIVSGAQLEVGDRLIGLASSGPHSNGYSLIRRILSATGVELGAELLAQLLAPTRIYARAVASLQEIMTIRGMAHITGGGLLENLPRMFSNVDLVARLDVDAWQRPEVFSWLQQAGNVEETEMLRTFNCGIGFVVCVEEALADEAIRRLADAGERAQIIGTLVAADHPPDSGYLLIR
jgi:phosphoribosylformylglycinamidine cyclo-ligase